MDYIHKYGKKGYVTLNVYARHNDFDNLKNYVQTLVDAKVDADIKNLSDHITDAAAALEEVDGRLDALEAFEETHAAISIDEIEGMFA